MIEVKTDTGLVGLAETYGAKRTLTGLQTVAPTLEGLDPYDLRDLRRRIETALPDAGGVNAPTALADHKLVDVVYSAPSRSPASTSAARRSVARFTTCWAARFARRSRSAATFSTSSPSAI